MSELRAVCKKCNGKGFNNPDGTAVGAYKGCDTDPVAVCKACHGTGWIEKRLEKSE